MKLALRKRTLVVSGAVGLLLLSAAVLVYRGSVGRGTLKPEVATDTRKDDRTTLEQLLDSLRGGPLEIRLEEHPNSSKSRDAAVSASKTWTGIEKEPAASWMVRVTDQEFIGGWLRDRHCWLLEYSNSLSWPTNGNENIKQTLYVLIDASTGVCWECFTRPAVSWWNRVKRKNEILLKNFETFGRRGVPAETAPELTLMGILETTVEDYRSFAVRSQQLMIRHFLYTPGSGTGITRMDGLEIIPRYQEAPVWCISFQGIHSSWLGSKGGEEDRSSSFPDDEEFNVIVSARTGKVLSGFVVR